MVHKLAKSVNSTTACTYAFYPPANTLCFTTTITNSLFELEYSSNSIIAHSEFNYIEN